MWENVRRVVDVGGGTGALLAEILRARPEVQGTLVDLLVAGGKTNAISEFEVLAEQAGLKLAAAGEQDAGFVVECRPA